MSPFARFLDSTAGRLALFVGALVGLWVPAALVWLVATGWAPGASFENLATFQLLGVSVLLYAAIFGVLWFISHRLDGRTLGQFGLAGDCANLRLLGLGLAVGWLGLVLLVGLEALLGWLVWEPAGLAGFGRMFAEGLLVGLAVASIEELLFRGFLMHTVERRNGWTAAALVSALLFAVAHFLKPLEAILASWPQFPGLVLMGLVLALARRRGDGRLGLAVGLHAGWVWAYYVLDTLDLVRYDHARTPEWLTGVGNNPLAGLAGIAFLVATGVLVASLPPVRTKAESNA
jgi:hypothetical protein